MPMVETTILVAISIVPLLKTVANSEPCSFNPLCTCILNQADITCLGVTFSYLPSLPTDNLYQVSIMKSGIEVLNNGSLKDNRLSSLRLMHNRLLKIHPKAFKGTEHLLTSLDLSFNRLTHIPVPSLRKLYHLQWLNLHGNRIEEVNGKELSSLGGKMSLRSLFLGENRLLKINDGVFTKFPILISLDLDNNMISQIEGRPFPSSLATLFLSHNQLTDVPLYALSNLKNLGWLHAGGNLFHEIPQTLPIPVKQINKLDFSNNLLTTLPTHMFNSSFLVRDLHLEFNFLKTINNSTFDGLRLERISLSNNRLSSLSPDSFHGLESTLRTIDLSFNLLTEFPSQLSTLQRVSHLYLRGNFLRQLEDSDLAGFGDTLEVLDLSSNLFIKIPMEALAFTTKVLRLSFQDNLISSIHSEDFNKWAKHLATLSLANNKLTSLPRDVFEHLPRLRELRLSYNRFSNVDPLFLQPVSASLEVLELSAAFAEQRYMPPIRLEGLSRVKLLQLDYNYFTNLTSSPLNSLPQIIHCDMEGNNIVDLEELFPSINPEAKVTGVHLSSNDIECIASDTFRELSHVTTIALYNNKIKEVKENGFRDMVALHTVILARNNLVNLEPASFRNLTHLTNVYLQENKLKTFSLNAFNKTGERASMYLDLSNNEIQELVVTWEHELEDENLEVKTLDLSHNLISVLPEGFLYPMADSLFYLSLSFNRLSNVSHVVCIDTPLLQMLKLDNNQIEFISANAFQGCPVIQVISLHNNLITEIPDELFYLSERIRILDLSNNQMYSLPDNCFWKTKLEILNLSRNFIEDIPTQALLSVANTLIHLDVSHNYLTAIAGVNGLRKLQSLNISSNFISQISSDHLKGLDHLLHLDLSNNPFWKLEAEWFHVISSLDSLNLDNVSVSSLPALPLPNLKSLKVSSNFLYNLSENSFLHLHNLRLLDLSRNFLQDVPNQLWSKIPDLTFLDISYNPVEILSSVSFVGLNRLTFLDIRGLKLKLVDSSTLYGLRYLRTLKTQSFSTIRLHDMLVKTSSLTRFEVKMEESMLSHQLQWTFGVKLRELIVTGERLTKILPDAFLGLQTHELVLRITGTSISQLPDGLLRYLADVRYLTLDLRGNRLSSMRPQVLSMDREWCNTLSGTQHIAGGVLLEDNPWVCSCDLLWLGEWLRRWMRETYRVHMLPFDKALHAQSVARKSVCTMPGGEIQIPIIDLRSEHLDCQNGGSSTNTSFVNIVITILLIITRR